MLIDKVRKMIVLGVALISLSACADNSQSQDPRADPSYVSPTQYENFNCRQLHAEMQRISAKLDAATQADNSNQILGAAVTAFAIARGYSLEGNDDDQAGIKRLQNEQDILERTAIEKDCTR